MWKRNIVVNPRSTIDVNLPYDLSCHVRYENCSVCLVFSSNVMVTWCKTSIYSKATLFVQAHDCCQRSVPHPLWVTLAASNIKGSQIPRMCNCEESSVWGERCNHTRNARLSRHSWKAYNCSGRRQMYENALQSETKGRLNTSPSS